MSWNVSVAHEDALSAPCSATCSEGRCARSDNGCMHSRDLLALTLLALAPACAQTALDPAIFKAPPAAYRGHAMWSFPLNTLNEKYVVDGIQEMAKLNYGGFFIEAGGFRPGGPAPL